MKAVTVYTDGACLGNPGPGGYAAILKYLGHEKVLQGADPKTTNQRMELMAAIAGLNALKEACAVEVVSDSQYLIKGMTEWIKQWQAKGWKNGRGRAVENRDLWEKLTSLAEKHQVKWTWVRGHNGHPENERCDRLANEAAQRNRRDPDAKG
jgi:ribonuclease HI